MSTGREAVLAAIRGALDGADGRDREPSTIPRAYRMAGGRSREERLELMVDRIQDYQARVFRCRRDALGSTVRARLEERSIQRLAVPADLPEDWLGKWGEEEAKVLRDDPSAPLSLTALSTVPGALTGCALAVAETGTLVQDGGRFQGRRALSLLPDYHLCVVFGRQVVETVPEAVRHFSARREAGGNPAFEPLTFISGPSATSDIELIRVEGVHGPRTLDVILTDDV